ARPGAVVRVEHHDPAAAPSRGPTNAPVTIELFFVPWSQSRSSGYRNLEALAAKHPTRIRLVYRVLEANGQSLLPPAALEAAAEGKFFAFMDAVNAERTDRQLTKAKVIEIGEKVGVDGQRLADVIEKHNATLDWNAKRLQRFHRSSPEALFNGMAPLH